MNNELNTVEDIDAMLDSQFNITDTPSVDVENEETDGDVTNSDTEEDENLSPEMNENIEDDGNENETTNDETETQNSDSKPSADDKKEFAFSKIRKENSDLKNQLNQKNEESEFLSRMATQYGYTDVKKFQADYEKARIEQEAKKLFEQEREKIQFKPDAVVDKTAELLAKLMRSKKNQKLP